MAESTSIEWCDATFNPWWGCQKVSPACDHCYAERDSKRFAPGRVLWGVGAERRTFGDAHWAAPLKWAAAEFVQCDSCGHRGRPVRVGVQRSGRACAHCDLECVREVNEKGAINRAHGSGPFGYADPSERMEDVCWADGSKFRLCTEGPK